METTPSFQSRIIVMFNLLIKEAVKIPDLLSPEHLLVSMFLYVCVLGYKNHTVLTAQPQEKFWLTLLEHIERRNWKEWIWDLK